MIAAAKKQLWIPISKLELYLVRKPLVLILTITCLQHFSGFTYTKVPAPNFRAFVKRGKAVVLITSKVIRITLALYGKCN